MAYKETFGGNVDYAFGSSKRGAFDIGKRLEQAASGWSSVTGKIRENRAAMRDLNKDWDRIGKAMDMTSNVKELKKLVAEEERLLDTTDKLNKSMSKMPLDMIGSGFDKVAKGILKLNVSAITGVFDFLIDSIKRVYELQEKWTRAIGGFNMKMGGLTAGLKGATKAATQWSGVMRGLTGGDIEAGIELFGEFTTAIGRVIQKGDGFSKFGLQLARGFNLGGSGAGQLAKVFGNVGMTAGESSKVMSELIDGANLAHVPVNMLAKDLEDSSTYMARFGKEGARGFVTAAAFARRFTISMKDLQRATERFDMFDEAAVTASKLNMAFGMAVNAIDLLLEDDPAARIEQLRQSFLAQGMTYDKMTVKQRRLAAETLQVSDDQLASLLNLKTAGVTYAEFQAKQAAKEKTEVQAKRQMELMLRKTAQTMYAFGAAFDRITVAIANAIKPLLVVLGLAKEGDKKFTSFGTVMASVTETVEEFFNSLAKNEKWKSFMRELAHDLVRFARALKEWVSNGGAADFIGDLAQGMKQFYIFVRDATIWTAKLFQPLIPYLKYVVTHSKEILSIWLAWKVAAKAVSFGQGVMDVVGGMGGGASGAARRRRAAKGGGRFGGLGSVAGRAAGGVGVGGLVGGVSEAVLGTGGMGAMIGGGLGAMIAGPIGGIIGSLGGALVEGISTWFSGTKSKTALQKAMEASAAELSKETTMKEHYRAVVEEQTKVAEIATDKRVGENARIAWLARESARRESDNLILSEKSLEVLRQRTQGFEALGAKNDKLKAAMDKLAIGTNIFTTDELKLFSDAVSATEKQITSLGIASQALLDVNMEELSKKRAQSGIALEEGAIKTGKTALEIAKAEEKAMLDRTTIAEDISDEERMKIVSEYAQNKKLSAMDTVALIKRSNQDVAIFKKRNEIYDKEKKLAEQELLVSKKRQKYDEQEYIFMQRKFIRDTLNADASGAFRTFSASRDYMDQEELLDAWLKQNPGDFGGAKAVSDLVGAGRGQIPGMASGGVVRRPTFALIGEAGPEAVVPLRSMANGRMRQPRKFGGSAARSLVTGGGGGETNVTIPVSLSIDGREIARTIAAASIRSRGD